MALGGVNRREHAADGVRELGAHLRLSSPVFRQARRPAGMPAGRRVHAHDDKPIAHRLAITSCARSHAVVTAPITTSRPVHVRVRPPSVPTFRSHLPS